MPDGSNNSPEILKSNLANIPIESDKGPDRFLTAITDYIETIDTQTVSCRKSVAEIRQDGTLDMLFEDGRRLSDILPVGVVLHSSPEPANLLGNVISMDPYKIAQGSLSEVCALAHEVGHFLALSNERKSNWLQKGALKYLQDGNPLNRLKFNNLSFNKKIQREVDAWNYGKAIADYFGIDEIFYEDLADVCIKDHFRHELNDCAKDFSFYKDTVSPDTMVEIYDSSQQTVTKITYQELLNLPKKMDQERHPQMRHEAKQKLGYRT